MLRVDVVIVTHYSMYWYKPVYMCLNAGMRHLTFCHGVNCNLKVTNNSRLI